jgi:1,4-alpha-glucan branching enzyme
VRPEHELKFYSAGHIRRPQGMSVAEMALQKAQRGLVALIASPGIPKINSGQEFGEDTPRTIDFCPINWEKLKRTLHHRHHDMVSRLIVTRRSFGALRSDNIYFEADDFVRDQVVRLRRWDEQGTVILAALNFSDAVRTVALDIPANGIWRDVVADQPFSLSAGHQPFELKPWQGLLLITIFLRP